MKDGMRLQEETETHRERHGRCMIMTYERMLVSVFAVWSG